MKQDALQDCMRVIMYSSDQCLDPMSSALDQEHPGSLSRIFQSERWTGYYGLALVIGGVTTGYWG